MHGLSLFKLQKNYDLQEKLAELETYRDILCRQLDNLLPYFEASGGGQLTGSSDHWLLI